jgi:chromate reductase, NAD(P)H dehydrogenase (quinone)
MKILVVAGSLRKDSFNRKVATVAAEAIRTRGHEVDHLDMREVEMPLYDGDLETSSGLPEGAKAFRARIAASQAIFLASPEYNNSVPGMMKNAIDWVSRGPDQPLGGKIVALSSASPGPYGGVRSLTAWRPIFRLLGATIISPELSVTFAAKAFDETGKFVQESHKKQLDVVVNELVRIATALSAAG